MKESVSVSFDDDVKDPSHAPANSRGEVILVIDDEPMIRMVVVETLEDRGYAVLEAPDGPTGMPILRSSVRIDLLVTDVGLPNGMNGKQIADAARAFRPELKVLFITGYADDTVFGDGPLQKGTHLLSKPFELNALADKVRDAIEG